MEAVDVVVEELRRKALDSMMKRQQQQQQQQKTEEPSKDLEDGELPTLQSTAELAGQVEALSREHDTLQMELRKHDELITQLIQQQTSLKEELKRVKDAIFQNKSQKFQVQAQLDEHREQLQQAIRQLVMVKKRERERFQREKQHAKLSVQPPEDSVTVSGESTVVSPASSEEKILLSQRLATIEQELAQLKACHIGKFDWRPYLQAINGPHLIKSLSSRSAVGWYRFGADQWLPAAWISTGSIGHSYFFPDLMSGTCVLPNDAPEWLTMLGRLLGMADKAEVVKQAMLVNAGCLDGEQWLLAWDLCHKHRIDPSPLLQAHPNHPLITALCVSRGCKVNVDSSLVKSALLASGHLKLLDSMERDADVTEIPFYSLLRIVTAGGKAVPEEFCMPSPLNFLLRSPFAIPPIVHLETKEQAREVEFLLTEHCIPHRLHAASLSLMTSLLLAGHSSALSLYQRTWPSCPSLTLFLALFKGDSTLLNFSPLTIYLLHSRCSDGVAGRRLLEEQWHRLAATLQPPLSHQQQQSTWTPDQIMGEDDGVLEGMSSGTRMLIEACRRNPLLQWSRATLNGNSQVPAFGQDDSIAFEWKYSHACLKPSFI